MTDPLDTSESEFEWGPRRRVEHWRERVSTTTLRARLPEIAMAIGATILIAGAILLWSSLSSSDAAAAPVEPPAATPSDLVAAPAREPYPTAAPAPVVIVHVSGHVAEPGIVEIALSARVFHAVEAAGGALEGAGLDGLNLAAPVVDGSQIHVPAQAVANGLADVLEPAAETSVQTPHDSAETTTSDPAAPSTASNDAPPNPDPQNAGGSAAQAAPLTNATSQEPAPPDATTEATPSTALTDTASTEPPADPWLPEEPNVIPPELAELMEDRATAPSADEVDAVLADAGLGESSS